MTETNILRESKLSKTETNVNGSESFGEWSDRNIANRNTHKDVDIGEYARSVRDKHKLEESNE